MLAISSRAIRVNPCSVCVCTISVPADILVQYDIGTTADRVILLVIKIEWVSDKMIKLFSDYM